MHPHPDDGLDEAAAHVVIVQQPRPDHRTIIVSYVDVDDDPWHPRLLCLCVPARLSHGVLAGYIDLDNRCLSEVQPRVCRIWSGEHDFTDLEHFDVDHGTSLIFEIRTSVGPDACVLLEPRNQDDLDAASDSESIDSASLLQTSRHVTRVSLTLSELLPPPKPTHIDCRRPLFLRNQLRDARWLQPVVDIAHLWWNPSTWWILRSLPVGLLRLISSLAFLSIC